MPKAPQQQTRPRQLARTQNSSPQLKIGGVVIACCILIVIWLSSRTNIASTHVRERNHDPVGPFNEHPIREFQTSTMPPLDDHIDSRQGEMLQSDHLSHESQVEDLRAPMPLDFESGTAPPRGRRGYVQADKDLSAPWTLKLAASNGMLLVSSLVVCIADMLC